MQRAGRERFGRRCDAVVHGGVVTLLGFSPLAFGAVHPWSQGTVQLLVVGLVAVWASKVRVCGGTSAANERLRRWRWPLVCFGAVAVIQLIPLPPGALRVLSPNTEAIYRGNLPGWPAREPFSDVMQTVAALSEPAQSNTPGDSFTRQLGALAERLPSMATWRPLSLYSYRGGEELLLMLTWAAVFFCSSGIRGRIQTTRLRAWQGPHPTTGLLLGCASGWRWSPQSR
jgi:hypothetical protein